MADLEIGQNSNDYISVYELIEWAKSEYENHIGDTAKDILRLLNGKQIKTYKHYTGLKSRIEKDDTDLIRMLNFAYINNGYEDLEIPF